MIRLNFKTEQDFLSKQWMEKMIEAKVPMEDNTYWLVEIDGTTYVTDDKTIAEDKGYPIYPTYTIADLEYKLSEWHPEYKGLIFWKDAPFYFAQYDTAKDSSPFVVYSEYPINAAAQLLINCMKEGIGCVNDISEKREL